MKKHYDLIVVGLGAMGAATLYQASKAGLRVLGIDSYHPPHHYGSSHGDSRITRMAIGEGEEYVPLAKRSGEIWHQLEKRSGEKLVHRCGGLILAPENNQFLETTEKAAQENDIPYFVLGADEIRDAFPMFSPGPGIKGFFEPGAGYLMPELAIEVQLRAASDLGAEIITDSPVQEWYVRGGVKQPTVSSTGITKLSRGNSGSKKYCQVKTEQGTFRSEKLVLAAGSWIGDLAPEIRRLFTVYQQMLYWFPVKAEYYEKMRRSPVFIWEWEGDEQNSLYGFYGFPALDGPRGGVKVATEQRERPTDPFTPTRQATEEEADDMYRTYLSPHMPWLEEEPVRSQSCLYTNTNNSRFLIDWHPGYESRVLILSPCSGHGFKHSAAIGELAADIIAERKPTPEAFSWGKLA